MQQAWWLLQLEGVGSPFLPMCCWGFVLPSTFCWGPVQLCLNPRGCRPGARTRGPPSSVWPCFLGRENSCPIGRAGDILCVGTRKLLPRLYFFYPTPELKSLPKSVTLGCLRELGGVKAYT